MTLIVHNDSAQKQLDGAREFAKSQGEDILAQLEEKLAYLEHYAGDTCECVLFKDFAPYSFEFTLSKVNSETGERRQWFQGGLVYHGPRSTGVGFPELSVTLSPSERGHWEIHT